METLSFIFGLLLWGVVVTLIVGVVLSALLWVAFLSVIIRQFVPKKEKK